MKYINIFIKNEFCAIRGKNWWNFWILFTVFLLSIGAISYSRSGLRFLKAKMEDPFINWINISNEPELDKFFDELMGGQFSEQTTITEHFNIHAGEKNNFLVEFVKGNRRIIGRTLDYNSSLWNKILNEANVKYNIKRTSSITDRDFGWVITADFLHNLGYTADHIPLFISLEYSTATSSHFAPIPIIAVVDRLPDDIDFVTTNYFYQQLRDLSYPFYVGDSLKYFSPLQFVTEMDIADAKQTQALLSDILAGIDLEWENPTIYEAAYQEATLLSAIVYDTTITMADLDSLCHTIEQAHPEIYRYYDYLFGTGYRMKPDYVSVMFNSLEKVKEFQQWSKNNFNIRIDMAQIEAKENFNRFNNLATLLCWAIVVIAVLFVLIFLSSLINCHFQKISKNLGTIMAFGLDKKDIMFIYLIVSIGLISISLMTSALLLYAIQSLLLFFNIGYELSGTILPYFNMTDFWVLSFIGGILLLSAVTTLWIMNRKLHFTPGDLIYERNN